MLKYENTKISKCKNHISFEIFLVINLILLNVA